MFLKLTGNREGLKKALIEFVTKQKRPFVPGKKILILSDKKIGSEFAPVPSLLSVGAVHQYLVEKRIRTQAGLVVEAGDAWEVQHFATIIGYGASAVNPYLALETIHFMNKHGLFYKPLADEEAFANYQKAIGNGLLKVMSKMGISTLQSYQSSQIFEALGIGSDVVEKCFKGTISRIEGLSFDDIANEVLVRHQLAFEIESKELHSRRRLPVETPG